MESPNDLVVIKFIFNLNSQVFVSFANNSIEGQATKVEEHVAKEHHV
jgi:hypothetical protein